MNPDYFAELDAALRRAGIGRPVVLLDLDRIDHNIDLIQTSLSHRFRVVTKSLPSGELIRYILSRTGGNRLMAFHLPFVAWMLETFPGCDILLGKPFLASAAEEFIGGAKPEDSLSRLQWLIDTPARLADYLALADRHEVRLRVNIELDVGLHRGGVSGTDELDVLLGQIAAHPGRLAFAGFMGYEAQVPYMPDPDAAFARAMDLYGGFVRHGEAGYPELFGGGLTFNSGGSKTCHRFAADSTVNDVAAGSAVVKPATFGELETHLPALFIAAPVIRKFPRVSRRAVDPAKAMSLYLYGGGWAADLVHPDGVTISPNADPPNQNLLPNQCLFETRLDTPLEPGNFVFFHPQQGDAMVQFEDIHVFRNRRLVDCWHPFPRRY